MKRIHLVGENISPYNEDNAPWIHIDLEGTQTGPPKHFWRRPLGALLERETLQFWRLPGDAATSFFPHDASVRTKPYPPAMIHVFMDLYGRKQGQIREYIVLIEGVTRAFLNDLRRSELEKGRAQSDPADTPRPIPEAHVVVRIEPLNPWPLYFETKME